MSTSKTERRGSKRHKVGLKAQITTLSSLGRRTVIEATLTDVSRDGAGMRSRVPLPQGAPVKLLLIDSGQNVEAPEQARARVVRCDAMEDGDYLLGFSFDKGEGLFLP